MSIFSSELQPRIEWQDYFSWLEPDQNKRNNLIKTIKLMMNPRVGSKSIILIRNGSIFIREAIMGLILSVAESSLTIGDLTNLFGRKFYSNSRMIEDYIHGSVIRIKLLEDVQERKRNGFAGLGTYPTQDRQSIWDNINHKESYIVPTCWFLLDESAVDIITDKNGKVLPLYEDRIIEIDLSCQSEPGYMAERQWNVRQNQTIYDAVNLNQLKNYVNTYN